MFTHVAGYRFVDLPEPESVRDRLKEAAAARSIKGTILLAHEGINFFVSGHDDSVQDFLELLQHEPGFQELDLKTTYSPDPCYKRLIVKVKPEIITFRAGGIRPQDSRAAAVEADVLRRWLESGVDDDGRPVLMVDTRNQFEVDAGTFHNAMSLEIEKFSELPQAAEPHLGDWKDKRVVTFCTGGIRCEKAAIYLQERGVPHVVQLDGGILRYFERERDAFWSGDLFVFDERREISPDLQPAGLSGSKAAPNEYDESHGRGIPSTS